MSSLEKSKNLREVCDEIMRQGQRLARRWHLLGWHRVSYIVGSLIITE